MSGVLFLDCPVRHTRPAPTNLKLIYVCRLCILHPLGNQHELTRYQPYQISFILGLNCTDHRRIIWFVPSKSFSCKPTSSPHPDRHPNNLPGIGLATAELLSSLSCLVIVADLSPPPASAAGGTLHFHKTDVASYSSLLSAFDKSFTTFGAYPDIVFANAGIGERGDLFGGVTDENVREEPKHEVLNIDSEAVANTVRIGWWGMKKRGGGNIILTASMAGYMGQPGLGMYVSFCFSGLAPDLFFSLHTNISLYFPLRYNAAKHSVVGLMRGLRYIGPKDNIAISLIAPAITSTPLISSSATSFEA